MHDELLRRLTADRDAGRLPPLHEVQRLHPGAEAEVAAVYARVADGTGGGSGARRGSTGAGLPAERTLTGPAALADTSRPRLSVRGEIGRGGMGVVLEVRDELLGRELAMKRASVEGAAPDDPEEAQRGAQLVQRLLEEAQVTAQLDHPGVVPVHELGLDAEGRVYFTMKRVHGRTLEAVLQERRAGAAWPLSRALQVLLRLCETLAYAHRKGVVHRDVKPANVMVGRFGEVYLMDWGVAKVRGTGPTPGATRPGGAPPGAPLPEGAPPVAGGAGGPAPEPAEAVRTARLEAAASGTGSQLTLDGQMVGTVGYMAPEQVIGAPVDERADVYAVGAMLYELLAGHAPYREPDAPGGARALWERLLHGAPAPLERRAPEAPPELVSIATKALARDPAQRFASAAGLADELHAFLEGRVVRSHRTGVWVEVRSWVRRNRGLSAALLAALLLAAGGAVAFVLQQRHAARAIGEQRDRAVAAAEEARAAQRRSDGLRLAALTGEALGRDAGLALALAVEAGRLAPGAASASALYRALRPHREVAYLDGHDGYASACWFLGDGRRVVSSDESGGRIVWDVEAAEGRLWDDGARSPAQDLVLAPGGEWAVTAHEDGRVRALDLSSGALRFDVAVPLSTLPVEPPRGSAQSPAALLHVGPDGRVVSAGGDGGVRRWSPEAPPGETLTTHGGPAWLARGLTPGAPWSVSLGAEGSLAVVPWDGGAGWRAPAAPPAPGAGAEAPGATPATFWARASAEAGRVLVRRPDGSAALLDLETGAEVLRRPARPALGDAAFSADGRRLLLMAAEGDPIRIEVLDPATGAVLGGFGAPRRALAPSPDGSLVALVGLTEVEVYDVERGVERARLSGHRYHVRAASWSPDGRRLCTASQDGTVRVWELRRASERDGLVAPVRAGARVLAFSDDGAHALLLAPPAAGAEAARALELRATDDGRVLARVAAPGAGAEHAALDASGRVLSWIEGRTWLALEAPTGRRVRATALAWPEALGEPGRLLPNPAGTRLAVRCGDRVLVFDGADGALRCALGAPDTFNRPAWHADGRHLALAHGREAEAALYDTDDGRRVRSFRGHSGFVIDVEVEAGGGRLATAAVDSTVRLWSSESGDELERTTGLPLRGSTIDWGPGGATLVHVANDLTLLDARPGARLAEHATLARGPEQRELRLHPDGRRFWTLDDEQRLRFWELDALAQGERSLTRPPLPHDRTSIEAARLLDAAGPFARFLSRPDPSWALQRAGLLLAADRPEEALAAAREAGERRPGWSRPGLLAARALGALASREPEGSAARAGRLAEAGEALRRATALGLGERVPLAGASVPPELAPHAGDAGLREALRALGFRLPR